MVAENGKLKDIDKIEELFASLMDAKSGMVQAVVTSAQELAKKDVTTITKALEKRLEKGKKLSVTTKVAAAPPASLSLSLSLCATAGRPAFTLVTEVCWGSVSLPCAAVFLPQVDASIIGGLVIELGDELADLSVASSLQSASAALQAEE